MNKIDCMYIASILTGSMGFIRELIDVFQLLFLVAGFIGAIYTIRVNRKKLKV
jgi:hypothetical protein